MSRTIRRKSVKPPRWVTHFDRWLSSETYEDKKLQKNLHKFYGDYGWNTKYASGRSAPRSFILCYQKSYRSNARLQIIRWLKNEEFECIIRDKPKLPYWD